MSKPWFAVIWFVLWGSFQTFVVLSILRGKWKRPAAFPEAAYNALIWPDMVFIPLYFAAAILLFIGSPLGVPVALVAGGGTLYVMIYLFALSKMKGKENLIWDGVFTVCTLAAIIQVSV